MSRVEGVGRVYPDRIAVNGREARKLSNEEALARDLTDSGGWYEYSDTGRIVLLPHVDEVLETDPILRERNERVRREDFIEVCV